MRFARRADAPGPSVAHDVVSHDRSRSPEIVELTGTWIALRFIQAKSDALSCVARMERSAIRGVLSKASAVRRALRCASAGPFV